MILRTALTLSLLAGPIAAQTPMTLQEFEAFVTGKTYTFAVVGDPAYGIEAYGPNRQVIWAELDDICYDGYYEAGTNNDICFFYPELNAQNCVQFYAEGKGLYGFGYDGVEYIAQTTTQTMPCIAPLLGS